MILKYETLPEQWSWVADLKRVTKLGENEPEEDEYDVDSVDKYIADYGVVMNYFLLDYLDGHVELIGVTARRAYLTTDTGSTIERLI